jgi:hypothetical protein
MRTILVGTLAATLVGCSCLLPPQVSMEACTDANGFACFDRAVASRPIEPKPESFKANSATIKAKTAIAAKREKPSSDDDRHLATKKAKSTVATARVEPPASGQPAEPSGPVITMAKTAIAKTEKPSPDDARDKDLATKKAKSTMTAGTVEPPASGQSAEPSGPVITMATTAKTAIAANTEDARDKDLATKKAKSTMTAAKVEPPASGQPAEPSDPVITMAKTAIAAKLENPASAEFGEMKRAIRKNTFGQSVDTICGRVKGKKASGENTGDRLFLYLVKEDDAYVVDGPPSSAAATAYRNICN